MALVRAVKTVVTRSRPLRATDAALTGDATSAANASVSLDRSRIATPKAALDALGADITTLLATLNPVVADPVTNRATILAQIDAYLDQAIALLQRAAGFRLASAGWGFALDGRHSAIAMLMTQVTALVDRWNGRLADYDARIAAYDALPAGHRRRGGSARWRRPRSSSPPRSSRCRPPRPCCARIWTARGPPSSRASASSAPCSIPAPRRSRPSWPS